MQRVQSNSGIFRCLDPESCRRTRKNKQIGKKLKQKNGNEVSSLRDSPLRFGFVLFFIHFSAAETREERRPTVGQPKAGALLVCHAFVLLPTWSSHPSPDDLNSQASRLFLALPGGLRPIELYVHGHFCGADLREEQYCIGQGNQNCEVAFSQLWMQ